MNNYTSVIGGINYKLVCKSDTFDVIATVLPKVGELITFRRVFYVVTNVDYLIEPNEVGTLVQTVFVEVKES